MKIISPTGLGIREHDEWGLGAFKSPRGKRLHKGTDFMLCKPGEKFEVGRPVYSPCNGKVCRKVYPYKGAGHYRGILITNDFGEFMMFYLMPFAGILHFGHKIMMGEEIGIAQDISKRNLPDKYPGMIPHVHLQIKIHGDNLLPFHLRFNEQFINPEVLM